MVDVAGRPTFGEACEQFVFDFVEAIFGAYDKHAGQRLISEFMLLISKKNGKSTIAAGIMVTALIRNWRDLAELMILAPTVEVANNSFKPAAAMVRASPKLSELLHIVENQRLIRHRVTNAELKIVAADSATVGGKKAGFILIDELWLFGKKADAGDMFEEATGGLASRPEGFVVYLTTHSDEPPSGVFKDKLAYFRDVRDGKIEDPSSFGMLYEWPEEMVEQKAYLQPENFYVTNPNMGRSVTQAFIGGKLRKAAAGEVDDDGETASMQVVLAKYLNVEIGLRLHRDRWRGADYWERRAEPGLSLEKLLDRSEVVVIGIDGGGLDDLFGLAVVGRDKKTQDWLSWGKAWVQQEVLKLRPVIAPTLQDFAKQGDLVLCQDATQDIDEVAALCVEIMERGLLPAEDAIGVDAAGIGALRQALHRAGVPEEMIVGVSQGWQLSRTIFTAERKLKNGTLWHADQPLMDFSVGNAKAEMRGSNIVITKEKAGRAKIDPLIALFNALRLMEDDPVASSSFGDGFGNWMKRLA